jgi:hypothetical protein
MPETDNAAIIPQGSGGGMPGPPGPPGPSGADGHSLLHGPTAPDNILTGHDGDYYIDTSFNILYGPKTAGVWPIPGIPLIEILHGSGAPDDGLGLDGQVYLDTTASALYRPKSGGHWPTPPTSLIGPAGTPGTDGSMWYSAAGVPNNAWGVNGDYDLNTTNGDVYKKVSNTWGIVGNIKGPPGAAGANGSTWYNGAGTPSTLHNDGDYYFNDTTGQVYQQQSGSWVLLFTLGSFGNAGGLTVFKGAGSYSWTVPDLGETSTGFLIEIVGAGGGGALGPFTPAPEGGGGGGGACVVEYQQLTPGTVLNIAIGAGGAAGQAPPPSAGTDGGDSTVVVSGVTIITARGGLGAPNATGGAGQSPTVTNLNNVIRMSVGVSGMSSFSTGNLGYTAGGAASFSGSILANLISSLYSTIVGGNIDAPGEGGQGGRASLNGGGSVLPGAGRDGYCIIHTSAKGIIGADGLTILNGVVPPTTQGVDGDFYIDTAASMIYGPKATTWPTAVSLIGAPGNPGTPGTPGADGLTILNGVVPPTTQGVDGDFYIDTAASMIYGPKATTWPSGVPLIGAPGVDGLTILNGVVPPTTQGVDGDFYIDTAASAIYGPKATTWPAAVSLIGAPGSPGTPGTPGAPGADGLTILNGIIPPTTEGVDGDFYIDTVGLMIYGPKATTWPSGISIVGPPGTPGSDAPHLKLFQSSGTFTVPDLGNANTDLYVELQGAGGGGAGADTVFDVGAGGGAGGYIRGVVTYPRGTVLTLHVGAGGAGGAADTNGVGGGTTEILKTGGAISAFGGGGGKNAANGYWGGVGGEVGDNGPSPYLYPLEVKIGTEGASSNSTNGHNFDGGIPQSIQGGRQNPVFLGQIDQNNVAAQQYVGGYHQVRDSHFTFGAGGEGASVASAAGNSGEDGYVLIRW